MDKIEIMNFLEIEVEIQSLSNKFIADYPVVKLAKY